MKIKYALHWFDEPPPKNSSGGFFAPGGFPKEVIDHFKEEKYTISPKGCWIYTIPH